MRTCPIDNSPQQELECLNLLYSIYIKYDRITRIPRYYTILHFPLSYTYFRRSPVSVSVSPHKLGSQKERDQGEIRRRSSSGPAGLLRSTNNSRKDSATLRVTTWEHFRTCYISHTSTVATLTKKTALGRPENLPTLLPRLRKVSAETAPYGPRQREALAF